MKKGSIFETERNPPSAGSLSAGAAACSGHDRRMRDSGDHCSGSGRRRRPECQGQSDPDPGLPL